MKNKNRPSCYSFQMYKLGENIRDAFSMGFVFKFIFRDSLSSTKFQCVLNESIIDSFLNTTNITVQLSDQEEQVFDFDFEFLNFSQREYKISSIKR